MVNWGWRSAVGLSVVLVRISRFCCPGLLQTPYYVLPSVIRMLNAIGDRSLSCTEMVTIACRLAGDGDLANLLLYDGRCVAWAGNEFIAVSMTGDY